MKNSPTERTESDSNIQKSRELIANLDQFGLKRNEKSIIINYVKSNQPITFIIPSCAHYIEKEVTSYDEQIIDGQIPKETLAALDNLKRLAEIFTNTGIEHRSLVLLTNRPKLGGIDLDKLDPQKFLLQSFQKEFRNNLELLFKQLGLPFDRTSNFSGMDSFFKDKELYNLEIEYLNHLTFHYIQPGSFQSSVQQKIKADQAKLQSSYNRQLQLREMEGFESFTIYKTLRHMADGMALGDCAPKVISNPIYLGPGKRDNPINFRNKLRLLRYGSIEQPTIPIIENF